MNEYTSNVKVLNMIRNTNPKHNTINTLEIKTLGSGGVDKLPYNMIPGAVCLLVELIAQNWSTAFVADLAGLARDLFSRYHADVVTFGRRTVTADFVYRLL